MSDIEDLIKKKEDLIKLYLTDSNKPKKYWFNLSVYNNQIIDKLTKEVEELKEDRDNWKKKRESGLEWFDAVLNVHSKDKKKFKEENTKLKEQLKESEESIKLLCECKMYKDSFGKDNQYLKQKKIAWKIAFELLTKNK